MLGNFKVAKVALSSTSYNYDMEYSYFVPEEIDKGIEAGMRVLVPFGRANRKRIGFVTRIYYKDYCDPALKPILNVIDTEPCVSEELLKIIIWLKENTFCTYFEALSTVIPKGLGINFNTKYSLTGKRSTKKLLEEETEVFERILDADTSREFESLLDSYVNSDKRNIIDSLVKKGYLSENDEFKRNVGDETVKMVRLSDEYLNSSIQLKLTEKQNKVIEMLEECECASVKEITYLCGITSSVVNSLVTKSVLEAYDYEVLRTPLPLEYEDKSPQEIVLSDSQREAYDGIKNLINEEKAGGALLHGITGSGKTAVFIKLIEHTLNIGKSVILLIPEISLTPQMVSKFRSLFGDTVAVLHSNLSLGQRADEYKRIKSGNAHIVIGTRSAVFAPLDNIGLIIMDEEGERTYKSEGSPRYHARDVAIQRCGYHNALLLMASATPSVESYYYATTGRYKLYELNERYLDAKLPEVIIVDMQLEAQSGNNSIFSNELMKKINENLSKKEQSILLLNRRGFHTYISCLDCREPLVCPHCSIPLTYHRPNGMLMCHYCGYSRKLEERCQNCNSTHLHPSGAGTQKLEDEIERLFPQARVLRMDADTTYSRYSYEKNFKDFSDGKYDIMIGTQMIAKGLDFPNVTLVGVLSLDKALFTGDFRSYERTFSLITQVVGRSGRGDKEGVAFIQTFVPDHYVLILAASQDYKDFFEEEIALRKVLVYPPFCDICVLGLSSPVESEVARASDLLIKIIKEEIEENSLKIPLRVLGPSKCTLGKINNKFRYRIIIKCRNSPQLRKLISNVLMKASKNRLFSNTSIYADINGDIGL